MGNFNSLLEVKEYLRRLLGQRHLITTELESKSNSFSVKKELQSHFKQIQKEIENVMTLLETYTTFNNRDMLIFLRKYLSIKENEKYILIGNDDYQASIQSDYLSCETNTFGETYTIITTLANGYKLLNYAENNASFDFSSDVSDFLYAAQDDKYICLETKDTQTLLKGLHLSKTYSSYPYLEDVAYELIDLKLATPSLSDRGRLEAVYANLKNEKKLIKH